MKKNHIIATERKESDFMPVQNFYHRTPHPHPLPHERIDLIRLYFDEDDFAVLSEIMENEDDALACEETILKAPPEIRVLAFQVMQIIHKLNAMMAENGKENK